VTVVRRFIRTAACAVIGLAALIGFATVAFRLIPRGLFYANNVVARVVSPDGKATAAVVDTDGGATVSTSRVIIDPGAGHDSRALLNGGGLWRIAVEFHQVDAGCALESKA
jgi:hypothetical protein